MKRYVTDVTCKETGRTYWRYDKYSTFITVRDAGDEVLFTISLKSSKDADKLMLDLLYEGVTE